MMAEPMDLSYALTMALDIAEGRRKFGVQFSPPYRAYEIQEACALLGQALSAARKTHELMKEEMVPKEELTKANRQYAALNARYERLRKKEDQTDE